MDYTIYKKEGKFLPVEKTDKFFGTLCKDGEVSGGYGLNLDFRDGFKSLDQAQRSMKEKWNVDQAKVIEIRDKFFVISNEKEPVAVAQSIVDIQTGKKIDEPGLNKNRITPIKPHLPNLSEKESKQWKARMQQHPNMYADMLRSEIKAGNLKYKECTAQRFNLLSRQQNRQITAAQQLKQTRQKKRAVELSR